MAILQHGRANKTIRLHTGIEQHRQRCLSIKRMYTCQPYQARISRNVSVWCANVDGEYFSEINGWWWKWNRHINFVIAFIGARRARRKVLIFNACFLSIGDGNGSSGRRNHVDLRIISSWVIVSRSRRECRQTSIE